MAKPATRIAALQALLVLAGVGLFGRAFYVQVVQHGAWAGKAVQLRTESDSVPARRGRKKASPRSDIAMRKVRRACAGSNFGATSTRLPIEGATSVWASALEQDGPRVFGDLARATRPELIELGRSGLAAGVVCPLAGQRRADRAFLPNPDTGAAVCGTSNRVKGDRQHASTRTPATRSTADGSPAQLAESAAGLAQEYARSV